MLWWYDSAEIIPSGAAFTAPVPEKSFIAFSRYLRSILAMFLLSVGTLAMSCFIASSRLPLLAEKSPEKVGWSGRVSLAAASLNTSVPLEA